MTTTAVIPARFASSRFPGKLLAQDTGQYLIQHVCERVGACPRVDRVVVATDDERIAKAVKSFGGVARMTRADHPCGTDRIGEVATAMEITGDDIVLNVQGDEPEIDPAALERLLDLMADQAHECEIGTLAAPFAEDGPQDGPGSPQDPNCVKVVTDASGRALYFSRSLLPYPRRTGGVVDRPSGWLLHLGVYAFKADVLRAIAADSTSGRSALEEVESLEQLRWLERGFSIHVARVDHGFVGIDTPQDYRAFVERMRSAGDQAGTGRCGTS